MHRCSRISIKTYVFNSQTCSPTQLPNLHYSAFEPPDGVNGPFIRKPTRTAGRAAHIVRCQRGVRCAVSLAFGSPIAKLFCVLSSFQRAYLSLWFSCSHLYLLFSSASSIFSFCGSARGMLLCGWCSVFSVFLVVSGSRSFYQVHCGSVYGAVRLQQ